ncbi:MAG: L-threonine 3-dehydrogenase [Deltaproteobacteria bacterium]|nr:L-threonine 3-dehydrogenase [Deltaproteobacteria bacterium]
MLALVKDRRGRGLSLRRVPVPGFGIDDVLVKVDQTGICGTDVHIYDWDDWAKRVIQPPLIIGHEFVGKIVDKGSNVKRFKIGDRVSGEGHIVCGRCRNCLAGRSHLCPETVSVGVNRDGAFAEYLALPADNVWRCSAKVPREIYAIFDPLGNAVHTALSFEVLGEDVLITGAGPIGIMAVTIVRQAGARHVVITDVNDYRLKLAEKMGATLAVNVKRERIDAVQKKLGMHEGFDVGLEMSGNPRALREMIANMVHGGKIAMLGIQPSKTGIDWNRIVFGGLTIKGIYGRQMYESWYKATMLIESGMDISPVITHRFAFEKFESGFAAIKAGRAGKVVLSWA